MIPDSVLKQFVTHLKCGIMSCHERIYTGLVHVKTNSLKLSGKQACQRQANITESDYANLSFHYSMKLYMD